MRDKYAFASEIANLYGLAGEYTAATEEYLAIMDVISEIKSIQGDRPLIMLDLHTNQHG